jgi:hypothetical protein
VKVVPTDRLSLEQLQRYAATFDEISDETGARYPAAAFIDWLRLEMSGPPRPVGRAERQLDREIPGVRLRQLVRG